MGKISKVVYNEMCYITFQSYFKNLSVYLVQRRVRSGHLGSLYTLLWQYSDVYVETHPISLHQYKRRVISWVADACETAVAYGYVSWIPP